VSVVCESPYLNRQDPKIAKPEDAWPDRWPCLAANRRNPPNPWLKTLKEESVTTDFTDEEMG